MAYAVLPPEMASPKATALLLAIALQESKALERRQLSSGPARGFWQFERGGALRGVMNHPQTRGLLASALKQLRFPEAVNDELECLWLIEANDAVAAVFARLLLWTLPEALPDEDQPLMAWEQYLRAWQPGKPHRASWNGYFDEAWTRVNLSSKEHP